MRSKLEIRIDKLVNIFKNMKINDKVIGDFLLKTTAQEVE